MWMCYWIKIEKKNWSMFQNEEKSKKKCMKIKCQRKFNDKTFINKWYLRLKNKFASKNENKKEEAFTDEWWVILQFYWNPNICKKFAGIPT